MLVMFDKRLIASVDGAHLELFILVRANGHTKRAPRLLMKSALPHRRKNQTSLFQKDRMSCKLLEANLNTGENEVFYLLTARSLSTNVVKKIWMI